jgi:hypothetical protein
MAAWHRMAIGVLAANFAFAGPQLCAQEPIDGATIANLISRLDAERFDDREDAAAQLRELGAPAIGPIVASFKGASRERLSRGLSVLVYLALKGEAEAQELAESAVEGVSKGAEPRAARIAAASLESIQTSKREESREILIALGAVIGDLADQEITGTWRLNDDVGFIDIGPEFRGTIGDLKHLRRLTDVQSITLGTAMANDDWMGAIIEKMPQLREFNIKRAKVTSAGLAKLHELERLHHVWICYMPVDEQGVQELRQLRVVSYLTLFGTGINKTMEQELVKDLPHANIDVRTGAFLGLGGSESPLGFRVRSISPGSAAEKMGIKVDDTLQSVNGSPVSSIDDLTRILSPLAAGTKVEIEYFNGSEAKKLDVTLGEWP